MDIDSATACELISAIRDRSVSSREVLDHLLARTERLNPDLNAVVALDVDRARAAAGAADAATAHGTAVGALHGLPMTVKDVWETEGLVTTSGAPELKAHIPKVDALAVARLKSAGAIIFGKTNTPLYAGDFQTFNDVYGLTRNPWDPARTAGGSSGGAAAAVATGLTPLELGSDIGGSIRNPAHYNGVYGMKPSWGVVPSRGHIPGPPGSLTEPDVNCNGPLARSLSDLSAALAVVAGPLPEAGVGWRLELDPGPEIRDVSQLRVATVLGEGRASYRSPETSSPVSSALRPGSPTPGRASTTWPCPLRSPTVCRHGGTWCCPSLGRACPTPTLLPSPHSTRWTPTTRSSRRRARSPAATAHGLVPTSAASISAGPGRRCSSATTSCSPR